MNKYMGLQIRETRMPMPDGHCIVSKTEFPGMWKTLWFGPLDRLTGAPEAEDADTIWLTKAGIEALVKRYEDQMVPL